MQMETVTDAQSRSVHEWIRFSLGCVYEEPAESILRKEEKDEIANSSNHM